MHEHCHQGHHQLNFESNVKKTFWVIVVTLITMGAEVTYGYLTKSMALLSDGWHMGTHAFALTITFVAYIFIKRMKNSSAFPEGTGKISALSGFVSSLFLAVTGLWVITESVIRFFNPEEIIFNTAIIVAVIGLLVNGLCLLIMESKEKNTDYNFKAAYLHILTDALTSVFAIVALLAGKYLGLYFLDPIMGMVGGVLILRWAIGLIKDTSIVLLDMNLHKDAHKYESSHLNCHSH